MFPRRFGESSSHDHTGSQLFFFSHSFCLSFGVFGFQEMAQEESKLSYTILLILTSGNVENVKETKECLINTSNEPLSVVIVGIGDADFTGMVR